MLTRWNARPVWGLPELDRMDALRRDMDRLFTELDRSFRPLSFDRAATLQPRMSLSDEGSELILRAELPGFAEGDVNVSLDRNTVTIHGQRSADVPEGYSVHRQERGTLAFARSFTLPCRVEADGVTATMNSGIFELRLPKAAEERPRQIQVQAS